jgi:hypothetical protein
LKREFKITFKTNASYFLGFELNRLEDGSIFVSQQAYTQKILERFGMAEAKPVNTPMEVTRKKVTFQGAGESDRDPDREEEEFPYRSAVGALMYLMVGTRPDIAYAVGKASRKLDKAEYSDWLCVKRIFRYLAGTRTHGLLYQADRDQQLVTYTDADHGGDTSTGRSTTGVVSMYAGAAVSWKSQLQTTVQVSTAGAEIVAASEGAREAIWLQRVLESLGSTTEKPIVYVDNQAAIKIAENPENHQRTKHIQLKHFYIREVLANKELSIEYCRTDDQLADALTKALPGPRFEQLRLQMGQVRQ